MARPGPLALLLPNGTRLIISTPHASTVSTAPDEIRPAARLVACWDDPHWLSTVVAATVSGRPAASHAVRAMLKDCSPTWLTHPPTTWSPSVGSMLARAMASRWTAPSRSAACMLDRPPPRRPIGLRTASTMTTSVMARQRTWLSADATRRTAPADAQRLQHEQEQRGSDDRDEQPSPGELVEADDGPGRPGQRAADQRPEDPDGDLGQAARTAVPGRHAGQRTGHEPEHQPADQPHTPTEGTGTRSREQRDCGHAAARRIASCSAARASASPLRPASLVCSSSRQSSARSSMRRNCFVFMVPIMNGGCDSYAGHR